ncbi:MAG TPA: signaling recognition particle receptor family protein [Gemmatimonadales bacterium]|nr:signaling recognition particle receptor family protein [Gemmatimonadales bacterium]
MGLWSKLGRVLGRRDPAARADAERILLDADFGPALADELLARLDQVPDRELEAALEREVRALSANGGPREVIRAATSPTVMLLYGVNGVGKTTTAAKLARRLQGRGREPLLAAADTFRAGAVSQLRIWAERLGVPFVGPSADGTGDSAAVAFDAVKAGAARGVDTVIVDTAGRLHTEDRLLEELKKVVRAVGKAHPAHDAPHESLLVLDGTVGQTAVRQAEAFAKEIPLTGTIITKLDGTARGGAVVALSRAVPSAVPRFVGTGETLEDLSLFDAEAFARRLVRD